MSECSLAYYYMNFLRCGQKIAIWYYRDMEQTNLVAKEGWSWGAFAFHLPFLIAVKRYTLIWWYLLAIIPLVNIIFFIVFAIYLGLNGHRLAVSGGQFTNQSEYDGYFKGINHAGKVIFFAMVIVVVLVLVLITAAFIFGVMAPHANSFGPGRYR